jgi:hypothetical protein
MIFEVAVEAIVVNELWMKSKLRLLFTRHKHPQTLNR